MTGSLLYMAPEVANEVPYSETCDSYSFAILLWEILALKRPYELYSCKSLREKVYNGPHKRPKIDDGWHNSIKLLLKRAWSKDLLHRSSMAQISKILRDETVRCRDGDDTGLDHLRRRSTYVYRPSAPETDVQRGHSILEAEALKGFAEENPSPESSREGPMEDMASMLKTDPVSDETPSQTALEMSASDIPSVPMMMKRDEPSMDMMLEI